MRHHTRASLCLDVPDSLFTSHHEAAHAQSREWSMGEVGVGVGWGWDGVGVRVGMV